MSAKKNGLYAPKLALIVATFALFKSYGHQKKLHI